MVKRKKVVKTKNKPKKMLNKDIYSYMAVLEPAEEGGFNVIFPALPGCFTYGDNLADAKKMAKEVLELWIEQLLSEKVVPPLKGGKPIIREINATVSKP